MRRLPWIAALLTLAVAAFGTPVRSISPDAVAAAERRLFPRCSALPLDMDALLADAVLRKDLETLPFSEAQDLVYYGACRSLQGKAGGCALLDGLGGGIGGGDVCRNAVARARLIFLTVRGGDAIGACRSMSEKDGKRGPSVERACAALVSAVRAGDAQTACSVFKREKLVEPDESCRTAMAPWLGKPQDCALIKDSWDRRACMEAAALTAGLRNAPLCAASSACRALDGKSAAACDGLRMSFTSSLCARARKSKSARPKYEKGQPMEAVSKDVKETMRMLEQGRSTKSPPAPGEADASRKKR